MMKERIAQECLDQEESARPVHSMSKAELFQVLQEGWNRLDVDLLRRLVESMPRRIQAVIDANGYMTKY